MTHCVAAAAAAAAAPAVIVDAFLGYVGTNWALSGEEPVLIHSALCSVSLTATTVERTTDPV